MYILNLSFSFQGFYHQEAMKFMSDVRGRELQSTLVKIALIHLIANHPLTTARCVCKSTLTFRPVPGHYKKFNYVSGTQTTKKNITNPSRNDLHEPKLYLLWQVFSMPIIPVLLFSVKCDIRFIPSIVYREAIT